MSWAQVCVGGWGRLLRHTAPDSPAQAWDRKRNTPGCFGRAQMQRHWPDDQDPQWWSLDWQGPPKCSMSRLYCKYLKTVSAYSDDWKNKVQCCLLLWVQAAEHSLQGVTDGHKELNLLYVLIREQDPPFHEVVNLGNKITRCMEDLQKGSQHNDVCPPKVQKLFGFSYGPKLTIGFSRILEYSGETDWGDRILLWATYGSSLRRTLLSLG